MPVFPATKETLGTVSQDLCEEIALHWGSCLLDPSPRRPSLPTPPWGLFPGGSRLRDPGPAPTQLCHCLSLLLFLQEKKLLLEHQLLSWNWDPTPHLPTNQDITPLLGPQVTRRLVSRASAPGLLQLSLCNDSRSNAFQCNPIETLRWPPAGFKTRNTLIRRPQWSLRTGLPPSPSHVLNSPPSPGVLATGVFSSSDMLTHAHTHTPSWNYILDLPEWLIPSCILLKYNAPLLCGKASFPKSTQVLFLYLWFIIVYVTMLSMLSHHCQCSLTFLAPWTSFVGANFFSRTGAWGMFSGDSSALLIYLLCALFLLLLHQLHLRSSGFRPWRSGTPAVS